MATHSLMKSDDVQKHDELIQLGSFVLSDEEYGVEVLKVETMEGFSYSEEKEGMRVEDHTEIPERGKGRILLMDDEEIIRDVAGEILDYLGYEVTFAKDGAEAIEMYSRAQKSGQPYDVTIMDLTIPGGMGGKEAIRYLKRLDPDIRAIVSSGYPNDPAMSDFREHGFSGVVQKPYRFDELSEQISRAMQG